MEEPEFSNAIMGRMVEMFRIPREDITGDFLGPITRRPSEYTLTTSTPTYSPCKWRHMEMSGRRPG